MDTTKRLLRLLVTCFGLSFALQAASMPMYIDQYYDSNAVLQQGVMLPVSGNCAAPGSRVTVDFNGTSASGAAGADGRWRVEIPPQKAGGPYRMTVTDGTQTLTATNILVGDVWLVSGQSNAGYPIERFAQKDDWAKDADYPGIRFIVAKEDHYDWQLNAKPWQVASEKTVGQCSATGFFFAKNLQRAVNAPIGIVVAAWNGSWIRQWMPGGMHYELMLRNELEPLIPFPIKGVVWYQGESDGMFARGYEHRFDLQAMIRDWREKWGAPEMPFLVAQLPHFGRYSLWYEIRDSQNWVARNERNVHVVPTLDLSDLNDIHPPKKPELGKRLCDFARKYVYGEKGLHPEGPVYRGIELKGREILVHFDVATAIRSTDGRPLNGFQVCADARGRFEKACARIVDERTVSVSCEGMEAPVAVRYGFVNEENVNFADAEGNAAGAFRSDDYQLPTEADSLRQDLARSSDE